MGKCIAPGMIILLVVWGCARQPLTFLDENNYGPDYAQLTMWAAHPDKIDAADSLLKEVQPNMTSRSVDIFFIHPTTYIGKRGENKWNAELDNEELNLRTDNSTILFQASIFNQVGRVYAPRYRQAHLHAYFTEDHEAAEKAFNFAYRDVRQAFLYFLSHYHHGRPLIIASHSQGTTHAKLLLKEFFDGKPLQDKLIAAYLVGMPVEKNYFTHLPICENPAQTSCYCSWRTFKLGYIPKKINYQDTIAVVNPLSWTTKPEKVDKKYNAGTVLYKYDHLHPHLVGAQIYHGILWADKPKFPGSFLLWRRNYHIADFNFFYLSTQQNAIKRVEEYFQQNQMSKSGSSR